MRLIANVLRLELNVDHLEPRVNCLELRVDLLEPGRLHLVSACFCFGFQRPCLHFQKLQIESRPNNLELRRDGLVMDQFSFECARYQTVRRRFNTLMPRLQTTHLHLPQGNLITIKH